MTLLIITQLLILIWQHLYLYISSNTLPLADCYGSNCLSNLGLEQDKLMSLHNKLCSWYSSHIVTQESAARMNDCDNTTGLPATRSQLLLTREKQGDENILSKLIETIPQKWGIERYVLTPRGEMYHENKEEKPHLLSIMYQAIVPLTIWYNIRCLGLLSMWNIFIFSLVYQLQISWKNTFQIVDIVISRHKYL